MKTASFQIEDRVAIVTGGSSGIGLATVQLLLDQGARVAFCGRDADKLEYSTDLLARQHQPSRWLASQADVLDRDAMQSFARQVEQHFGQADMLIVNAGQGRVASLDQTADEHWLSETRLKLFGLLYPLQAFSAALQASPIASITCVNSLLALQPEPHMIATSAARAALLNLTHSLAHSLLEQGIRVNSILLGMVESAQWRQRYEQRSERDLDWPAWSAGVAAQRGIPMGRMGHAHEAAHALLFLASPLASYTTGASLDVSGGFNRHL